VNRSELELESVLDSDLDLNAARVVPLNFVQRIRKGRPTEINRKRSREEQKEADGSVKERGNRREERRR
jgi:hypothetical protein